MRLPLPARDSLQARLLAWLTAALAALIAAMAWHAYHVALSAANTAYDRSLLAVARVIAERVELAGDRVRVEVPYVALDFFEADLRGRVFYRVTGLEGEFVSGFDDLPAPPPGVPRSEEYFALARFYEADYRGEPVRVVALLQPVGDDRKRGMALIQVAETLVSREAISERLLRSTVASELALVVLAAVVIVIAVRVALRPVRRAGAQLMAREASDLAPLDTASLPAEVRPIAEGMNDYMTRLAALLEAQERFIADASHQLRTPLTLAKAQAELALREADPRRQHEIVEAIHASVGDTVRLANQLLGHARSRHGLAHPSFTAVDLAAIARHCALELAPAALARGIAPAYEGPDSAVLRGDPVLLQELVRNLLDNAIRYSRAGGRVVVRVAPSPALSLEVEDAGPGIPPAERPRVFEPFVRGEAVREAGAGLGLAISRDVARAHGARIELRDLPEGAFAVRVEFAASRTAPAPEG